MQIKGLRNILFGGQGMFMDRFITRGQPGLLILHGYGNVFERRLAAGESILATHSVSYEWFRTGIWFQVGSGNETETVYPLGLFLDRFHAPNGPGLLMLHASGNVFVRDLAPGQTVLVKPTSLIFKDPRVLMHLHFEYPANPSRSWFGLSWSNRYLWLRLQGPGRVAVRSEFEHPEDPARMVTASSGASSRQW